MTNLLWAWLGLALLLVVMVGWAQRRAGPLLPSYFVGLSIIHFPGALGYVGAAAGSVEQATIETGIRAVLAGLCSLLAGALVAQLMAASRQAPVIAHQPRDAGRFGLILLGLGVLAYFVVLPASALVPSASSIVSGAGALLIIGLWYYFFQLVRQRKLVQTLISAAALPLLPLSTMITGGFIGYGIYWLLSVGALIYVASRRRLKYLVIAPIAVFAGLSFAVAYFGEREALRQVVWQEQAGLEDRLEIARNMIGVLAPLDIDNPEHVAPLLLRLNESQHLGLGIERHRQGVVELVRGATVPAWALIPRALWPDKPQVGGGKELVSDFTGVTFAEGTSVGAGQPLEFYMNFGGPGLIGGFLILGFILGRLDVAVSRGLYECDIRRLLRAGLPGLALLQPGGNLLEILVAAVAAVIVALLVEQALRQISALDSGGRLVARAPFAPASGQLRPGS